MKVIYSTTNYTSGTNKALGQGFYAYTTVKSKGEISQYENKNNTKASMIISANPGDDFFYASINKKKFMQLSTQFLK